jgi:hypothetical protein
MARDPDLLHHRTWLGFVQKTGLVVSASALVAAQVYADANVIAAQQALLSLFPAVDDPARFSRSLARRWDADDEVALPSLPAFLFAVLDWTPADLAGGPGGPALPSSLDVALPDYSDVLTPSFAAVDPDRAGAFLLLIREEGRGVDLDKSAALDDHHWSASPQARFERLLRENDVPIGLLGNGTHLRVVYAPRGESSGHLTFAVKALCEVAGRPLLSGLRMLLEAGRLFSGPKAQRLPALLRESRKYQNEVSTALAEQVLEALAELLRGFQAADEAMQGALLRDVLEVDRSLVYGGLLTTLMRLVFVLYAEDRGLLPSDPIYTGNYAVTGLFEKLRADDGRFHDSMGQRYGAWAQLLTLFRVLHDGASHGALELPERSGSLFNPDAYPFLEGRPHGTKRSMHERLTPPKVADGVVFRVLDKLLYLDGERLSYRALDVSQIGSVYEGIMGFGLEIAEGRSIGVRPDHVVVDLEALLREKPEERVKRLAAIKCKPAKADGIKKAKSVEELVTALGKKVSPRTPDVLPAGSLFLQPTEERRRSGSHYTPRSLTEPIVLTTLDPVLAALVPADAPVPAAEKMRRASQPPPRKAGPKPEEILALKVADPAMGSGAFLVEACDYLAKALVTAWHEHGGMPVLPLDEDPELHARRLIAQKCLYGVDKNRFAVDLAKLSLWLFTLAKQHPFTFLDHALMHGDSLVGLGREQIASFTWDLGAQAQVTTFRPVVDKALKEAERLRGELHALGDSDETHEKQRLLDAADDALADVRLLGDLVVATYFGEGKEKIRQKRLESHAHKAKLMLDGKSSRPDLEQIVSVLRHGERPVPVFHWETEFPEVFSRKNSGFDCIVGNPPFAGRNTLFSGFGERYLYYLIDSFEHAHGSSDLVAYFFRRSFSLLRIGGTFGLIATNTIAQGDTRATGLQWICQHGGVIYGVQRRYRWPAAAAVIVSIIHVKKGSGLSRAVLDGQVVAQISAFLFHSGGSDSPRPLASNAGKSFKGVLVYGHGFLFDDLDPAASPLSEMRALIEKSPRNGERIFPYLGGEEINSSPMQAPHRYVINFNGWSEDDARAWPELMRIVEAKVKVERGKLGDNGDARRRKQYWWHWGQSSKSLFDGISHLRRMIVLSQVSAHLSLAFLSASHVVAHTVVVFADETYALLGVLQSRSHEAWARFFGSSMKDDLRYTPSDCFETFPFPVPFDPTDDPAVEAHRAALEAAGKTYYEYRAALMIRNNEGLTTTYNRFHAPDEHDPEIQKLRDLHEAMDRAVLAAYGWADLPTRCEFLLDYEEEELDDEEDTGKRKRKKPYRYRWPDEVRDEVLARLIDLNQRRAEEERRLGIAPRQARAKTDDEDEADEA